ncbi:hypothetical protein [Halocynthiibacter styelae]|uniref:Uncharacterized protein n=1 Tax=Halocynthiibacter styelae TaxID=2761955 RepID=A0A8J7LTP5_9RHOB|nr:hypothetical protein [Paenihalocynthiibacter styelae]MBI1492037.1 hypothetical protein [Paenihalocynthiibacter styelae]
MFEVYLDGLLSGRQIFIAICTFFVGSAMGNSRLGFIWKLFWSLPILLIQQGFLLGSEYMESLDFLIRHGAAGSRSEDLAYVILFLIATHVSLYFAFWGLGAAGRETLDTELRENAAQITTDDMIRELNVIAAHPEMSMSGWLAQRWLPMSEPERREWVSSRLPALRELWLQGEEGGLHAFELELPQQLAIIDMEGTS